MTTENIDCRGMACPSPVLKTKEATDREEVDGVSVLVDNIAAKENVSRFLTRTGFHVNVAEENGTIAVKGTRNGAGEASPAEEEVVKAASTAEKPAKTLVLLGTDVLGRGDPTLGGKLIVSFVGTLKEMGGELWRLVLLNAGVKLATEGSPVLEELRKLEESGVHILVCGTCLGHFGILEEKRAGETTNMLDIVTSMQLADKVINLT